jgi:hypothetical protein
MTQDPYIGEKLNRAGFEFLLRDIEIGLTFVQIARESVDDAEKKFRNQSNTRKAYEKVQELALRLHLSPERHKELTRNLEELKAKLMEIGSGSRVTDNCRQPTTMKLNWNDYSSLAGFPIAVPFRLTICRVLPQAPGLSRDPVH